jgi:hypothetical protein
MPNAPSILSPANRWCLRFWRDERGLVFVFTVIVYLMLFVVCMSAYAIGETVRQRIELQNAVDAAAYSAATAQADGIARVAAINQAMAFTYAQLCRMQMDYIMDRFVEEVYRRWKDRQDEMEDINKSSWGCRQPIYGAGNYMIPGLLEWNGRVWRWPPVTGWTLPIYRIVAASQGKTSYQLMLPILTAEIELLRMGAAEQDIIDALAGSDPTRDAVGTAARTVLKANLAAAAADGEAGADFRYALRYAEAGDYFLPDPIREDHFLSYVDIDDADAYLGTGAGDWYVRKSGMIRRGYRQTGALRAKWTYWSTWWMCLPSGGAIVIPWPLPFVSWDTVTGDDALSGVSTIFSDTLIPPMPRVLLPNYFSEDGAIVVAAARPINNPFWFMAPDSGHGTPYAFFNASDSGTRYMWAVGAARAGYRRTDDSLPDGVYHNSVLGFVDDAWNLKTTDWEPLLLSLEDATSGMFGGSDRGGLLSELASGQWRGFDDAPTSSPVAAPTRAAPTGTGSTGNIDFNSLGDWLEH